MAHASFQARPTKIRKLTPLIRELSFTYITRPGSPFQTGQFYMMNIPTAQGAAKRAYSILSSHHDLFGFQLLIKLIPGGIASTFVDSLAIDQVVDFTGPFGKAFFHQPPTEHVLFLSTGAGLAPHYSMLLSESESLKHTRVHVAVGVWERAEVFYEAELAGLKSKIPNFSYEFVLDKGDATWSGKTGYLTQHLDAFQISNSASTVYACGNPDMIKGIKHALLDERHFPKDQFIAEAFTHTPAKSA